MISLGHNELIVWLPSEGLSFSENTFQIFFMVIIKIIFTEMCWYLSLVILLLVMSQHWFRRWLVITRQQAITFFTFTNFEKDICCHIVNTLRPRQNGRHFPDDIFKYIFLNENLWISIKISLKFVPKGPINNIPALVQVMAWRRPGDKPLSDPMMVKFTNAYMRHSASIS